jgi:HEAT repeat protein
MHFDLPSPRALRALWLAAAFALAVSNTRAQLDLPRTQAPASRPAASGAQGRPDREPSPAASAPALPAARGEDLLSDSFDRFERELRTAGAAAALGLPPVRAPESAAASGELLLPSASPAPASGTAPAAVIQASERENAEAVLARVAQRGASASAIEHAALELLGHGAHGLSVAREALADARGPVLQCAARCLALGAQPQDLAALRARLMSTSAPDDALALHALIEALAPGVLDGPTCAALLDHPASAMRLRASRALASIAASGAAAHELLPALEASLASNRSDTRLRALEAVAGFRDEHARALLVRCLGDARAEVALRAARSLAERDSSTSDEQLRALALPSGPYDPRARRVAAYALLALDARAQLGAQVALRSEDLGTVLARLRSGDALERGTAAIALASAGIVLAPVEEASWYDREVPHELVRILAGLEFHPDFSSLWPLAAQRMELLSGERFGHDGPAWRDWWVQNRDGFRARRAVVHATPADAPQLQLALRAPGEALFVRLTGRAAATVEDGLEEIVLSDEQAAQLYALLLECGAFEAQRAPGVREVRSGFARVLELRLGQQSKVFGFGTPAEDWFERLVAHVHERAREGAWQRLSGAPSGALRRSFCERERAFWESDASPAERERREFELVLERARASAAGMDERELERWLTRSRAAGFARAQDADVWLELLEREEVFGARAQLLVELALAAARSEGGEAPLALDRARALSSALLRRFGEAAGGAAAEIVAAAPIALALELAQSVDPLARGSAVRALGACREAECVRALGQLLSDRDEGVEARALASIALDELPNYADAIYARAEYGRPLVRPAAVRAVGHLQSARARALLLSALASSDPRLQSSALEGLGALGATDLVPAILVQLARGPASPVYEAARGALFALGEGAHEELLRAAQSSTHPARRESALLLARQAQPAVASTLLALALGAPQDASLAYELRVLCGRDLASEEAWWAWWDAADQKDALSWFTSGLRAAGLPAPAEGALRGGGTLAGALALTDVLDCGQPHLAERARRELERLLGEALGPAPALGPELDAWRMHVRERARLRYASTRSEQAPQGDA